MPHIIGSDGVRLYDEEAGSGQALVFVHEFAGEYRSWEARCATSPASTAAWPTTPAAIRRRTCPRSPDDYSFEHQRSDVKAMLDGLGIERAHVVGLSMGAFATFYFGMKWPSARCR